MLDKLNLIYNEQDDIYIFKNSVFIDYSDGSEDYFIDLFKKIDKIKSYDVSLQKYIKDWATKYHLSYIRTNLLDSVLQLFKKDGKVLELGGGMGAITPWLAENFKSVDAIEGSNKRAKALRLRTKNTENVRVFVGDINEIEYPEIDYDVITLIGVMEYIPFYSQNASPMSVCKCFLERIGKYLKKDGILIIAIENKLGAKYLSGCTEDHNGQLFSGVMGYPNNSPITFRRNELEELTKQSGFKNSQFYHIFPDYKLPQLFFREDSKVYQTSSSIFNRGIFPDYSGKREYFFMEQLFMDTLYQAKLLHQLSNSFLVLCSKSSTTNLKTDWLIKKYWNRINSRPEFHHCINFIEKDNRLFVERKPLEVGKKEAEFEKINFELKNDFFKYGDCLNKEAYRAILKNDRYSSLIGLLKNVREELITYYSCEECDAEGYTLVSGKAIDYCLWNLNRTKDMKLQFIDQKWDYQERITEDFVIFRSLLGLYPEVYPFIAEEKQSNFIIKIMKEIYPQYNMERFTMNYIKEREFEKNITITDEVFDDNIAYKKYFLWMKKDYRYWVNEETKFCVQLMGRLDNGQTFIWGAGGHTLKLFKLFDRIKFQVMISGIIDSNSEKNNTFINSIPVLSKNNFLTNKFDICKNIIISSQSYEDEIYNELKEIVGNRINLIRLYDGSFNTDLII